MSAKSVGIPLVVITYQDAFLWTLKHKKTEYYKSASIIQLSEEDRKSLGVSVGEAVTLMNKTGKIEVRVEVDKSCPEGFGFMPKSPVINRLISFGEKIPNFKGVDVVADVHTGRDQIDESVSQQSKLKEE
jgi:formylmethanofuran dehydrogenase subunit D